MTISRQSTTPMLRASRATFILLLLFAPLAFGSVEPWAFFILVLLTGLSLLFYLTDRLQTGQPLYQVPCLIPLLLVGVYLVFQLTPLPASMLGVISPRSLSSWQKSAGLFASGILYPVSLDIRGGVVELSRFLVCCGFYVLAIQLLSDGNMFKRVTLTIAFFGGLLALSSILQAIFTVDRLLWFRPLAARLNPFGPYVNSNHYAGLMGMLFPVALALAFALRPSRQFGSWREKILGFLDDEDFLRFLLLGLGAVAMALSVAMSLSRGGMISLCLSLIFFVMAVFRTARTGRGSPLAGLAVMTAVLIVALVAAMNWFGWENVFHEFDSVGAEVESTSPASRYQIAKTGLNTIRDFPLTGSGFGSFRNVFPRYMDHDPFHVVDHAHNDYLELIIEGGLIGALLSFAVFLCLFLATLRFLKKRVEPYAVLICLGAMAGLVAILLHSLVDFNLHINANALYAAFLGALMVSAAHTRFRDHLKSGTYLTPCGPGTSLAMMIVFIIIWIPLLVLSAGQWAGTHYAAPFKRLTAEAKKDQAVREAMSTATQRASLVDPLEAIYRVMTGDIAMASGDFSHALTAFQKAILLAPTRSEFLQRAGAAAYYSNQAGLADTLMAAGIDFYPSRPEFYARYAAFLLKTDKDSEARDVIRKGLLLGPNTIEMFFNVMRDAKMTPAEMYIAMADRSYAWARFAAYIEKTDYDFMKKEILLKAVNAADREETPSPRVYSTLAAFCVKEKNDEEAIAVLERGIAKLPDQVGLMYELATIFDRLQITYKAVELYKKILLLNPGHKSARSRLENPVKSGKPVKGNP
ncbi:MAG: O-antigen ligase family protein [Thermodesulfobacteriota bacterium]